MPSQTSVVAEHLEREEMLVVDVDVQVPPRAPGCFPAVGHLPVLLRNPLAFMKSLPRFGRVVRVRLGPRTLYVLNSHELVRTIMVSESEKCRRGIIFEKAKKVLGQSLICAEGDAHHRQRRLLQPSFNKPALAQCHSAMVDVVVAECGSSVRGEVFDVNSRMHNLALEMQRRALFRARLAADAAARVKQATPSMMAGIAAQALYPAPWLEKLPLPVNRRFEAAVPLMRSAVDELIGNYRAAGFADGDVLATLLSTRDPDTGGGMRDDQLRDEIINLVAAGSEAVPPTLSWVFHELARSQPRPNPEQSQDITDPNRRPSLWRRAANMQAPGGGRAGRRRTGLSTLLAAMAPEPLLRGTGRHYVHEKRPTAATL